MLGQASVVRGISQGGRLAYSDRRVRGGIKALSSSELSPDPDWESPARAFHNFTRAFVLFAASSPLCAGSPRLAISGIAAREEGIAACGFTRPLTLSRTAPTLGSMNPPPVPDADRTATRPELDPLVPVILS